MEMGGYTVPTQEPKQALNEVTASGGAWISETTGLVHVSPGAQSYKVARSNIVFHQ